jgi:hypothetical protein
VGWGTGTWGTSPWGLSAATATITVDNAVAISTNTVRVTLSTEPKNISTTAAGDALNPSTWVVTRLDTGAGFTELFVTKVSATQYDITIVEQFADVSVTHRVLTTTLKSAAGNLVGTPNFADFLGITNFAVVEPSKIGLTDFANSPFPFNPPGGTLEISAGGDYAMISGAKLVRKLIYRRLVTSPKEFFHLPNYGVGLRLKEPLPTNDLVKLTAEIERQVELEPEVESAAAVVEFTPSKNLLVVIVRAKLKDGEGSVELTTNLPSSLVSL